MTSFIQTPGTSANLANTLLSQVSSYAGYSQLQPQPHFPEAKPSASYSTVNFLNTAPLQTIILDEPNTSLHFHAVEQLLKFLHQST